MDKIAELKANHNLNFEKKYWAGKFTKPLREQHKISICTTCMDRGFDLKKTLPKNIEDNKSYPHLEFVILDYNGKDQIGK